MSAWVCDIRLVGARHTSCSSWWTRSISSHAVASAAAYACSGARRRVPGGRSRGLALSAQPACSILVKRESSHALRSQHSPTAPIVLLCSYSSLAMRLPVGFVDLLWRCPRRLQWMEHLFFVRRLTPFLSRSLPPLAPLRPLLLARIRPLPSRRPLRRRSRRPPPPPSLPLPLLRSRTCEKPNFLNFIFSDSFLTRL